VKVVFCEPPALASSDPENRPPERLFGCSFELYHFPDLANLYPAAVLGEAGFEVSIIDAVLEGLSAETFFKRIEKSGGDAFVFHSVLLSKATDLKAAEEICRRLPDAKIIYHGPEPTRVPDAFLDDAKAVVIRGEPEWALRDFLQDKPTAGLSRRVNGEIEHTPISGELIDLDQLPLPARDHPDIAPFASRLFNPKFETGPFTPMMASRGCAFRCLFCVPNSVSFSRETEYLRVFGKKPKVAVASAAKVIAEFESIAKQGYRSVSIIDDQFLWSKERTLEICNGVKDLGLEWGILSRADFLDDPEIVCALRDAGCTSVDIGVESLSQKTLDFVNKDLKVEKVEQAVNTCRECGLEPKLNILFGASPTEDASAVRKTVSELRRLGLQRVMFSIATPFKGTRFHDHCTQNSYLVDDSDEIDPVHKSMISYPAPGMDKKTLERETRRAYRSFYLHPGSIWRRLKSIRSWEEFVNNVKIARRLF
jgi:radical SAM superfamily enzyme YgiQ (UPF0313 family)